MNDKFFFSCSMYTFFGRLCILATRFQNRIHKCLYSNKIIPSRIHTCWLRTSLRLFWKRRILSVAIILAASFTVFSCKKAHFFWTWCVILLIRLTRLKAIFSTMTSVVFTGMRCKQVHQWGKILASLQERSSGISWNRLMPRSLVVAFCTCGKNHGISNVMFAIKILRIIVIFNKTKEEIQNMSNKQTWIRL